MRPLRDWQFNPALPLQTKRGTAQALRCGEDKVEELISHSLLTTVRIGRSLRITTTSIMDVAAKGDQREVA